MVLNDQKLAKRMARTSLDQHLFPYNYTPPDTSWAMSVWQEDIFQETPQWGAVMTVQFSLVFSPLWEIWPFLGHTAVPVLHSSLLFRDLLHLTCKFLLHNLITVNMKQSMFKVLCFLYLKCTLRMTLNVGPEKKRVKLDIFQDWKLFLCERQASVWERMVSIHIPAWGTQATACEEHLKPVNKKWSNLI